MRQKELPYQRPVTDLYIIETVPCFVNQLTA